MGIGWLIANEFKFIEVESVLLFRKRSGLSSLSLGGGIGGREDLGRPVEVSY